MRVKQESVQRSLYLSDDLIDSDRVSADKLPVDVLLRQFTSITFYAWMTTC
jgi:hypothetical protein